MLSNLGKQELDNLTIVKKAQIIELVVFPHFCDIHGDNATVCNMLKQHGTCLVETVQVQDI